MSDHRQSGELDDLVYMLTGVDENGDTHIFVTTDLRRAEARQCEVVGDMTDVKANWLNE